VIPLVRSLVGELAAADVRYCHWKSNTFLDRSATGENDLDVLVCRADGDRFEEVLRRLSFKEAVSSAPLPGIFDWYGYDEEADRIVHAHVHYRLIVGDDLTKSYWLPLEDALLEGAAPRDGTFPVPRPEIELIALVVRLTLKHSALDAMLTRRGAVPRSARAELDDLRARSDAAEVDRLVDAHLPFVGVPLFRACEQALEPGCAMRARAAACRSLQRAMRGCARRSQAADVTLKAWGLVAERLPRRGGGKRLRRTGAVIAVVGADGAGKSTLVDDLVAWLGPFRVKRFHLGKPPVSPRRRLLEGAERIERRFRRRPTGDGAVRPLTATAAAAAVALARDRWRAHVRTRRFALEGGIAVCDRYPVPQLTRMDAPRLQGAGGAAPRQVAREAALYAAIQPPDTLVVLRVDPEVAVARRRDEREDFVRSRNREVYETDWTGTPACVVDAGRPAAEVLAAVKRLVWDRL
jgi:thymidylate kinase